MRTPKMRRKIDGRFVVRLEGKDTYLGRDRAEAERQYYLLLSGAIRKPGETEAVYVCDLIEQYLNYHEKYDQVSERTTSALRFLNRGFGHYRPDQIGMPEIVRLRDLIMQPNPKTGKRRVRNEVNRLMRDCARFWKWCAAHEVAPAEIYAKFGVLEPLKFGRCRLPESKPVTPVPLDAVRAVQGNVAQSVAAMIDLQLLTGARPGEIAKLKAEDIDRSGEVWVAHLAAHKTAYRGHGRVLFFGQQAQAVLKPYILKRGGTGFLFSPRDYLVEKHEKAVCPRRENQQDCPRKTTRTVHDHYTTDSYARAIRRGCEAAGIETWHPHQLRHTAATELRKQYGVEVTRAVLGHKHVQATEIYAEVDAQVAQRVAAERG